MTPTQPTATTTEALRLPEGTLSMQGNDITIAYATREDAERAFDVLEAALSTAPSGDGVPGMVLVPSEPTDAMLHAAINAIPMDKYIDVGARRSKVTLSTDECATIYRAMLSSAPSGAKP